MNLTSWNQTVSAIATNGNDYSSDYVFYLHMISECRLKFDNELRAPASINFEYDHYNLFINLDKWDKLELAHRIGIVKHEMLHILYQHVFRKEERDHENFNIACDCALNQHIRREHLPESAVLPDTLAAVLTAQIGKPTTVPPNLTSEDYYQLLQDLMDKYPDKFPSRCLEDGLGQVDDHSKWNESKGDKEIAKDMAKKMLDKAADQTQKSRGNLPKQYAGWVEALAAKPSIRWQQVLKNIAGNKRVDSVRTFYKPNRRLPDMMHIKGKVKSRKYSLIAVADVSGSVSDKELMYGLNEIHHISKLTQTNTKLIQVDTEAYPPEDIGSELRTFKRKASGGTYISAALTVANDHHLDYNAIVVITDGYLDKGDIDKFNSTNKRVIWLLTADVDHTLFEYGKMQAFRIQVGK